MAAVKLQRATLVLLACLGSSVGVRGDIVLPPFLAPKVERAPELELSPVPDEFRVRLELRKYQLTAQEREMVAACIVLEAASQGELGMRGVMAVIRNRARAQPELFALTILREKQFSAMNTHTAGRESLWRLIQRAKADRTWPQALALVDAAQRDDWHDPTGGATHYTRSAERTAWTRSLAKTVTIGAHSFYR